MAVELITRYAIEYDPDREGPVDPCGPVRAAYFDADVDADRIEVTLLARVDAVDLPEPCPRGDDRMFVNAAGPARFYPGAGIPPDAWLPVGRMRLVDARAVVQTSERLAEALIGRAAAEAEREELQRSFRQRLGAGYRLIRLEQRGWARRRRPGERRDHYVTEPASAWTRPDDGGDWLPVVFVADERNDLAP